MYFCHIGWQGAGPTLPIKTMDRIETSAGNLAAARQPGTTVVRKNAKDFRIIRFAIDLDFEEVD